MIEFNNNNQLGHFNWWSDYKIDDTNNYHIADGHFNWWSDDNEYDKSFNNNNSKIKKVYRNILNIFNFYRK